MTTKTTSVSLEDSPPRPRPLFSVNTTPNQHRTPSTFCKLTPRNLSSRKLARTPGVDRYVPSRSAGDIEFSRFQISTPDPVLKSSGNIPSVDTSSANRDRGKFAMRECLLALKGRSSENRVLTLAHQQPSSSCLYQTTPGKCEVVLQIKLYCYLETKLFE